MNLHLQDDQIRTILFVDDLQDEHILMQHKFFAFAGDQIQLICALDTNAAVQAILNNEIDLVLLDNRLDPEPDFKSSIPKIRNTGFTGPIGIVSSSIEDAAINEFDNYGADFRMGKDEIDDVSIRYILSVYSKSPLPEACDGDYSN